MPTAEELRLLKSEERKMFKATGIPVNLIRNASPKAQWYKGDGTPLPNLLPADAYHIVRYQRRGWSMLEPTVAPVETSVEAPAGIGSPVSHIHRYGKNTGSLCKVNGCDAARVTPYKKRRSRAVVA